MAFNTEGVQEVIARAPHERLYNRILTTGVNIPRLAAIIATIPTGYTPCEPRGHLVSDIALRCAHGAICAWLACASTDSLTLDYVASGSTDRAVKDRILKLFESRTVIFQSRPWRVYHQTKGLDIINTQCCISSLRKEIQPMADDIHLRW